jgi:hypothetical protein
VAPRQSNHSTPRRTPHSPPLLRTPMRTTTPRRTPHSPPLFRTPMRTTTPPRTNSPRKPCRKLRLA